MSIFLRTQQARGLLRRLQPKFGINSHDYSGQYTRSDLPHLTSEYVPSEAFASSFKKSRPSLLL